jgi:hypothetical protein
MTQRGFHLGSALDSLKPPRAGGAPAPTPSREQRRFPTGCGTDPGWHRHRAHGQDPCVPCTQAHNNALKAWAKARTARATTPED